MPARPAISGFAWHEATTAGLGFALAFGWLWYAPLRDLWLTDILTGTLFSGRGTSAFFTALALTLLCGGLGAEKLGYFFAEQRRRTSLTNDAALAHGAALPATFCAALLSFFGGPSPGWLSIPAGAALGFAGGIGGAHWTATLLRLPPPAAARALGMAALTAAGLYGLGTAAGPSAGAVFPAACVFVALLLSLFPVAEEQKNPPAGETGGPCPVGTGEHCEDQGFLMKEKAPEASLLPLLSPLTIFFALGALLSALDGQNAPPSWAQCPLEGAGALAAGLFCSIRLKRQETTEEASTRFWHWTFAATLVLPLASLAFSPWPPLFGLGLFLCSGMAQGLAVAFLALRTRNAGRDAPRSARFGLLGLLVVINAGFYAGARVALMWNKDSLGLAALVLPCVGLLFLTFRPARRQARTAAETSDLAPEPMRKKEIDPQQLFTAWKLTPRETNIAALVRSGFSNQEIAGSAGISENTVRIHLKNLYRKSGCSSREELLEKLGS